MNKPTVKAIRNKIVAAIRYARKEGYRVVDCETYSAKKCVVCPIAAFLLKQGLLPKRGDIRVRAACTQAAALLRIEPNDIDAFMSGFDGQDDETTFNSHEDWIDGQRRLSGDALVSAKRYYKLGCELRKEVFK